MVEATRWQNGPAGYRRLYRIINLVENEISVTKEKIVLKKTKQVMVPTSLSGDDDNGNADLISLSIYSIGCKTVQRDRSHSGNGKVAGCGYMCLETDSLDVETRVCMHF